MTCKPLNDTISLDRAWQQGRRIYVRCGYKSILNTQMRQLGAHWDHEKRALWVGSTKKPAVLELLAEAAERIEKIERVKALGLWVAIPRGAAEARKSAQKLGCLFDRDRKEWAAPTIQAREQVEHLVAKYRQTKRAERKKAERELAELEAEIAQVPERDPEEVTGQVLAQRAGRQATGEMATHQRVSTQYMRRGQAQSMLHKVGEVITLADGRRGVVVEAKAWFTDEESASSVCWHDQTHDQAHWDLWHRVAIVVDTEAEAAQRRERQEQERDAAEVHAVMETAWHWHQVHQGSYVVPAEDLVGRIECRYGSGFVLQDGGTLFLTRDGRVVFTHPGWEDDDYQGTWREISDEVLVGRARRLVEAGDRVRSFTVQMGYEYRVVSS